MYELVGYTFPGPRFPPCLNNIPGQDKYEYFFQNYCVMEDRREYQKSPRLEQSFFMEKFHELSAGLDTEYPVSNATECLGRLRGSEIFSIGDLLSGYWQIPMDEASIYLTAFSSPYGQHEHCVMPMGCVGSANTFCRIMNKVGADLVH